MKIRILIARFLIAIVTFFNLQAAIIFLLTPSSYSPGFEVSGIPGEVVVRGMGILFIMWNVPYLVALINPIKFRVSLIEAVIMQAIGLLGESILLLTLPEGHLNLRMTANRFIAFDGGGLLFLIVAFLVTIRNFPPLKILFNDKNP